MHRSMLDGFGVSCNLPLTYLMVLESQVRLNFCKANAPFLLLLLLLLDRQTINSYPAMVSRISNLDKKWCWRITAKVTFMRRVYTSWAMVFEVIKSYIIRHTWRSDANQIATTRKSISITHPPIQLTLSIKGILT